jgi:hypothetical protein
LEQLAHGFQHRLLGNRVLAAVFLILAAFLAKFGDKFGNHAVGSIRFPAFFRHRFISMLPYRISMLPYRISMLPYRIGLLPYRIGLLPYRIGLLPYRIGLRACLRQLFFGLAACFSLSV